MWVPTGRGRDVDSRQLWGGRGLGWLDRMVPPGRRPYADLCGWPLARAHARSGDRVAIAAYLGSGEAFDRAVCAFAEAYADRNEADHAALSEAVASGRIEAIEGV